MHLARLWNTARKGTDGGYSLEALSKDHRVLNGRNLSDIATDEHIPIQKTSMMDLFGVPVKKKDGSDGKLKELPLIEDIQVTSSLSTTLFLSSKGLICVL